MLSSCATLNTMGPAYNSIAYRPNTHVCKTITAQHKCAVIKNVIKNEIKPGFRCKKLVSNFKWPYLLAEIWPFEI